MPDNDGDPPTDLALSLSEMKRSLDVGLTAIRGQLDVILQRLESSDRRADEHAQRLAAQEERLRVVERESVTQGQLSARFKQVVGVVTLLVTIAGVAVAYFGG